MEGAFIACNELALEKIFGLASIDLASIDTGQQGQGPMVPRLGGGDQPGSETCGLARLQNFYFLIYSSSDLQKDLEKTRSVA